MKDAEIIKGLECCVNNGDCRECALNPKKGNYGYCTGLAIKSALNLINRKEAEIARLEEKNSNLTSDLTSLQNDLTSAKAEIERLNKEADLFADIGKIYSEVKAEAYKEFAERLKHIIMRSPKNHISITAKDIDNLLKELVGEDK